MRKSLVEALIPILLLYVGISAPAWAGSAIPPAALKGKFAFDWMHANQSKCQALTNKDVAKFKKSFECSNSKGITSAAGVPVVAHCTTHSQDTDFMIFQSNADCVREREAQVPKGQ